MENPCSYSQPNSFTVDPECSHRPDKGKSKKAVNNNTREGRKCTKRSREFSNSFKKAQSEPFHLENDVSDLMSPSLTFLVHSVSSENTYEVRINKTPSCTCYYFTKKERSRKQVCKHMLWVYLFVLRVHENNDIMMQIALTDEELLQLYGDRRLVPIHRIRTSRP